ncbi:MAG: Valyl-tRNA synthetase [Candidatus Nomurabacteria bacterium GW2011_GWF2_35_66]|uniref:Valine--tRNA ligase n=1 Tax=Candidatus Nomurabacteria bacterium GW2011_GWE1_35_16 TaxID=1618761 RepID=A0A0G0DTG0_9BACT|nr:MAG: Valyl-tRNA synthetase [Candidatus Nomurabacteria bacterium GW2011_GWF1_34_20]KKP62871.1 MAG: Valyl-tRNA synthetase [Candidatus Nomurabacteria bacterium GW2011_GWE2_34_25]KKP66270.1 MAG: Valyl-tRNA synthetase [Candidatus Nomurabacteria bacterium GW2011_GWE1_35_16]KKP83103.1 MAG: Valyl-tRNA synthetase [Candidatus Nomurabacteria bacterium GW2011_GWF2_35_66]HAE36697.1 valine--tRNA ligase [Candidatus Nomurabacteria bacterium]
MQEPNIDPKLLNPYDPKETEGRIYKIWEDSGFFNPDVCIEKGVTDKDAKPFTIVMPPPNANGKLHAGHALFVTLEDIMTRYHRMKGERTLWVPGADHAGFETQIVYERKLEKEGRSRFDMKPEDLYKEIYDFTIANKEFMENDVRRLGASCDWSREKFTLDPEVVKNVQITFDKMFKDGLIYRGDRIVNWCAKHQTSLSEVETEFEERTEPFYYMQYGPFVISTSRPETKFGDKYVVMHPDDKRYADYKDGQKIDLEWINGPITATVIKDESVDMEFGTGVMTITPWHDQVDFEIAERHNLEKEQIIDWKGKLLPIAGEFEGIHISKARPMIIEKLKQKGLLVKIDEAYKHNVKVCFKCNTIIEPQIKDQWFVKMRPLADRALEAVNSGKIKFFPENYEKIFRYWMTNTIDWNISRQIVWGIPIPAKICNSCKKGFSDLSDELKVCDCGGLLRKDTDTFDTWFSSGQWTLLSLGYPDAQDLDIYHPTNVMETGRDLIFKWIPRMVIFALYLHDEVAFENVYLHGLVNDEKGEKMSKSKGNVVNPIELIDIYGSDALRIALVVGNTPGMDLALSRDRIKGYKNFANKLWNITRFVMSSIQDQNFKKSELNEQDKKIMDEFNLEIKDITTDMENFRFYLASEKIYHYIWHTFADIIIEESKSILLGSDEGQKISRQTLLLEILEKSLKILHPFMPFVTEEIWSIMPIDNKKLLMVEKWPI